MSSGANQLDFVEASEATERHRSSVVEKRDLEKPYQAKKNSVPPHYDSAEDSQPDTLVGPNGEQYPTDEEARTLRRVCGKIPWVAWTIAFIELCERFSYYGTTAVFVNFIQQDLPEGSNTGAIVGGSGQPGALGMGQRASTGLTLFNAFWAVSHLVVPSIPVLTPTVFYASPWCLHRRYLPWPLQDHLVVHPRRSHWSHLYRHCEHTASDSAPECGYRYLLRRSYHLRCRNGRFQIQYLSLDR